MAAFGGKVVTLAAILRRAHTHSFSPLALVVEQLLPFTSSNYDFETSHKAVCSEYIFSLTNEYTNMFVASKSIKYWPNE